MTVLASPHHNTHVIMRYHEFMTSGILDTSSDNIYYIILKVNQIKHYAITKNGSTPILLRKNV